MKEEKKIEFYIQTEMFEIEVFLHLTVCKQKTVYLR